jgi:hypothetical protein
LPEPRQQHPANACLNQYPLHLIQRDPFVPPGTEPGHAGGFTIGRRLRVTVDRP